MVHYNWWINRREFKTQFCSRLGVWWTWTFHNPVVYVVAWLFSCLLMETIYENSCHVTLSSANSEFSSLLNRYYARREFKTQHYSRLGIWSTGIWCTIFFMYGGNLVPKRHNLLLLRSCFLLNWTLKWIPLSLLRGSPHVTKCLDHLGIWASKQTTPPYRCPTLPPLLPDPPLYVAYMYLNVTIFPNDLLLAW